METPQRTFSRLELCRAIWNSRVPIHSRTIDVSVGRLRKALCVKGRHDPIRTIRGEGFALGDPSSEKDFVTVSEQEQAHSKPPRSGYHSGSSPSMRSRFASIEIVRMDRIVCRLGRRINLSPKPFAVFDLLFSNVGRVFSREQIAEAVWGRGGVDLRTVDAMVRRVRRAINGDVLADPIRTLKGEGYKTEFFQERHCAWPSRKKLRLPRR